MAPNRTASVRADLAAAGLMPEGHSVPGPDGNAVSAASDLQSMRRRDSVRRRQDGLGSLREGWLIVSIKAGDEEGGVTSHRGVLHPDEYVDTAALQAMVERELGFSYEQVRSVYRQGPLGPEQRELRARIDARVLALSESGANVALLGQALGFPIKSNGNCRAMENALARARKEQS